MCARAMSEIESAPIGAYAYTRSASVASLGLAPLPVVQQRSAWALAEWVENNATVRGYERLALVQTRLPADFLLVEGTARAPGALRAGTWGVALLRERTRDRAMRTLAAAWAVNYVDTFDRAGASELSAFLDATRRERAPVVALHFAFLRRPLVWWHFNPLKLHDASSSKFAALWEQRYAEDARLAAHRTVRSAKFHGGTAPAPAADLAEPDTPPPPPLPLERPGLVTAEIAPCPKCAQCGARALFRDARSLAVCGAACQRAFYEK